MLYLLQITHLKKQKKKINLQKIIIHQLILLTQLYIRIYLREKRLKNNSQINNSVKSVYRCQIKPLPSWEYILSDAGHTLRKPHGGQVAAAWECIISDAGHAVGNGHGG